MKPSAVFGFSKNLLVVLMLVLPASQSVAQAKMDSSQTALNANAWALQAEIGSGFSISGIQGLAFSMKWHFTKQDAARLGLSINASTSETTDIGDNSNVNITTTYQVIYYVNPDAPVNVFYGFGPLLGYSYSKQTFAFLNSDGTSQPITDSQVTYSIGAVGVLGVEWFFAKKVSIIAEYGVTASFKRLQESTSTLKTTDTYSFSTNAARLGLSFYF